LKPAAGVNSTPVLVADEVDPPSAGPSRNVTVTGNDPGFGYWWFPTTKYWLS
jgi:hypothetical protein